MLAKSRTQRSQRNSHCPQSNSIAQVSLALWTCVFTPPPPTSLPSSLLSTHSSPSPLTPLPLPSLLSLSLLLPSLLRSACWRCYSCCPKGLQDKANKSGMNQTLLLLCSNVTLKLCSCHVRHQMFSPAHHHLNLSQLTARAISVYICCVRLMLYISWLYNDHTTSF